MKKTRILFACTNYGPIESEIYKNHLAVVSHASRMFDLPYIGVTDKMYTHTASNMLAEGALESCIDYVFFTENDMILPFNIIETLYNDIIKTKLDAISGLYFLRGDGTQPCLYNNGGNKENPFLHIPIVLVPENQIFTIDCCGMGCVLMNVDVFADMARDYWWLRGGVQNQFEVRRHDISDAFCIPGPWSQPEVLPSYNPNNMQLRSYAGDITIDLSTAGVTVTAPEVSVIASSTAAVAAPIVTVTSPEVDVVTASASVKAVGGIAQPLVNAAWLTWFTTNIVPFLASKGYTGPAMPAISTTTVLEAQ